MKRDKILFYVFTGLLSLMMLGSAGMYFFNHEEVTATFLSLGFPTFVIYPLAVAKLAGVATVLSRPGRAIVEWAYAGFFFNFALATSGHLVVEDGDFAGGLIAMGMLGLSYFFSKRAFPAT